MYLITGSCHVSIWISLVFPICSSRWFHALSSVYRVVLSLKLSFSPLIIKNKSVCLSPYHFLSPYINLVFFSSGNPRNLLLWFLILINYLGDSYSSHFCILSNDYCFMSANITKRFLFLVIDYECFQVKDLPGHECTFLNRTWYSPNLLECNRFSTTFKYVNNF